MGFDIMSLQKGRGTVQARSKADEGRAVLKYIDVEDLVPSEDNFYSMSAIDELAALIELSGGVKQPGLVVPLGGGKYKVNKAISGINGLGLTIPDWVPVIGGKSFSINIPEIPMLAKGGFTNGPSIAGEAGTEAVISFQKSARSQNIDTWMQAGKMLGVGNQPAELLDLPAGAGGNPGFSITFAPHVEIKGNADKNVVDQALEESEQRFEAWLEANFERLYNQMERERGRRAYV